MDIDNIVTPVNPNKLKEMLTEANYDNEKIDYLYEGFSKGFDLGCQGVCEEAMYSPNLKLRIGSKAELWNKVMAEVKEKRYAGPFTEPPFTKFIQSPIGLVPKDSGKKTRLIFHLSYPKSGGSVNHRIPEECSKVKYPDFTDAVKLCLKLGKSCKISRSDISRAFRNVPLCRKSWPFLILKAQNPEDGKWYYFLDKCLPFGSSSSCKIFTAVSDSLAYLVWWKSKSENINYLDDFFFAALKKLWCDNQTKFFLSICETLGFPVALEKTFWGTTIMTFLGLLLNTVDQTVSIPIEKIQKALGLVEYFLNKHNKKVTVLDFQRLTGVLNFLSKCVIPGRTFTRRLYARFSSKLLPHHHVRLTQENRLDLAIWRQFLNHPSIFVRPFIDLGIFTAEELDLYSDASGNFRKGYGAYCDSHWISGQWSEQFMKKHKPSIEYLELYALTVGVMLWIRNFPNKRIILFTDNKSVRDMINISSSSCKQCMVLIRLIVFESLIRNVRIFARYVSSKDNDKADALSRLDMKRFWKLDKENKMDKYPTELPEELWPMENLWIS